MKISKFLINEVIIYLIKKYDKMFIIFSLYTIKIKIIIFPMIVLILL